MQKKEQSERISKMRAAIETKLAGRSARQRGDEKKRIALLWIYRWGWASPTTIGLVAGDNQAGLSARLVKRGYLVKTRTESGGGQRDVPTYLLTLTSEGVHEVERHLTDPDDLLPYELDPYRINQAVLRHDQMAQTATAKSLAAGSITGYDTQRELAAKSQPGVKQPDVIWRQADKRIGVEVELTAKWDRSLDQFVWGVMRAMAKQPNDAPSRWHTTALVSDSAAILARYKKAFSGGADLGVWERDENSRHWKKQKSIKLPDWVQERMVWKLVDHK